MKYLIAIALMLPLAADAAFGGGYRGGGSTSRSFSRSSSSRSFGGSYSRPSAPTMRPSSSFGGFYSRPSAPIMRPSGVPTAPIVRPFRAPPAPQVEHHYHSSGGGGFFNGYLLGSLMNRSHTTAVVSGAPAEMVVERDHSFFGVILDLIFAALLIWLVVYLVRRFLL